MVGNSSEDIRLTRNLEISGETIPPRNLTIMTKACNYDDYQGIILDEIKENRQTCVKFSTENDWISFKDVDFGKGVNAFEASVFSEFKERAWLEIRIDSPDGKLLGKCLIDKINLNDYLCSIASVDGKHDVFIKARGELGLYKFRFYQL